MKYNPEDIFTPQGTLEEVEKNPNLDFLMNIFNIPRAFGVSGFGGNWNIGKHSMAAAFIAFFWAKFNKFPEDRKYRLVSMALLHDLHEAVTGDILPMFKTKTTKKQFDAIQKNILTALGTEDDMSLKVDLKIIDLIAFLYEIKQVSPSILNIKKLQLANRIAEKQLEVLYKYCKEQSIDTKKIKKFLKLLDI